MVQRNRHGGAKRDRCTLEQDGEHVSGNVRNGLSISSGKGSRDELHTTFTRAMSEARIAEVGLTAHASWLSAMQNAEKSRVLAIRGISRLFWQRYLALKSRSSLHLRTLLEVESQDPSSRCQTLFFLTTQARPQSWVALAISTWLTCAKTMEAFNQLISQTRFRQLTTTRSPASTSFRNGIARLCTFAEIDQAMNGARDEKFCR